MDRVVWGIGVGEERDKWENEGEGIWERDK